MRVPAAALLAALLAACGPDPVLTSSGKVDIAPAAPVAAPPAAPVVAPPPAVAKAAVKRPGSAERAAYAKAKKNADVAACLRAAADHNGDVCVFYGTLDPPKVLVKEVTAASCRFERQK